MPTRFCVLLVVLFVSMHAALGQEPPNAEALYQQHLQKTKPSTGQDWFSMAEWCRQRLLLTRAEYAYRRAATLDPTATAKALYAIANIQLTWSFGCFHRQVKHIDTAVQIRLHMKIFKAIKYRHVSCATAGV